MSFATRPAKHHPKLRVVVVDDSSICRDSISLVLEEDGDIEVVGQGEDGFTALSLVETLAPDLVTMDIQMPGKSGIEAMTQIMARRPVPILVVTAVPLGEDDSLGLTAIENGALEVTAKPALGDSAAASDLRRLVRELAKTPVFQLTDHAGSATACPPQSRVHGCIGVVAGGGGMSSVLGLLARLEGTVKRPIVIHLPMAHDIAAGFAKHVAQLVSRPVVLAEQGPVPCREGSIVLVLGRRARWSSHTELALEDGEASADDFLESLASVWGQSAVAVVLSGQGSDGVKGLGLLRTSGATTIVESRLSARTRELPEAVVAAGAAEQELRLEDIAHQLGVLAWG